MSAKGGQIRSLRDLFGQKFIIWGEEPRVISILGEEPSDEYYEIRGSMAYFYFLLKEIDEDYLLVEKMDWRDNDSSWGELEIPIHPEMIILDEGGSRIITTAGVMNNVVSLADYKKRGSENNQTIL